MSTIKCEECGKEVPEETKQCPNCGFIIKKSKAKIIIPIAIIPIVILIMAVIYINTPNYKYNKASKLEQAEKYEDALSLYKEIDGYNDSKEKIKTLTRKTLHLDEVVELINNKALYYNGGNETTLCKITFASQDATIEKVTFDGNGQHKTETNTYKWDLDTEKIIIDNGININYKIENGNITFEEGKYFTIEQVREGLQGYWKLRETSYIKYFGFTVNEYNIFINGDKITAQSAAKSALEEGSYNYFGPEEKSYSLNIGEISAPNDDGTVGGLFYEYSFNIINNQITVLHFGKIMEKADSLPDVNCYAF